MASFIRGTTPEFQVTIEGSTYEELGTVIFRIRQGATYIDKRPTIADNTATVRLTQAETLQFEEGTVYLQLMGILGPEETEYVPKSDIVEIEVLRSLWGEAVHNGR